MTLNDDRKARLATAVKWSIGVAAAALVAPIVFLAIKGAVGIIVATILGLAIVNFAPVLSMKFANWKLRAIKSEAATNPIETLENLIIAKEAAFERFKSAVETGVKARRDFAQKTEAFKTRYPHRAAEFEQSLANMTEVMRQKTQALRDAQQTLEDAHHKLDEMRAYWAMSQDLQAANEQTGMDTGDLYEKMKADTAVDAVFGSVNAAFAQLEVAAALNDAPPQAITHNPAQVIDMSTARNHIEVPR